MAVKKTGTGAKQVEVTSSTPKIINSKWLDVNGEEITHSSQKSKVKIELETINILETIEVLIKENVKEEEGSILKTLSVTTTNNTATSAEFEIEEIWDKKTLIILVKEGVAGIEKEHVGKNFIISCCSKCIKANEKGDFIEELNIRLCGFGGIQPKNKMDGDTIMAVKNFQKNYMKTEETGLICKHVLEKLDEFKDKYSISFNQLKCTCGSNDVEKLNRITGANEKGSCSGFGNINDRKKDVVLTGTECAPTIEKVTKDGKTTEVVKETTHTIENEYSNYVLAYNYKDNNPKNKSKLNKEWIKADSNRQIKTTKYITKLKYTPSVGSNSCYEYPGMHRSLMWAYKAIAFYLEKEYGETDTKYTINKISSGYRCRYQDTFQNAGSGLTFNHMGTALDIHFNKNGVRTTDHPKEMDKLRDEICVKYIGAHKGWIANKLGLELALHGANSWIHIDVREFSSYKADKFFKTTEDDINGGKLSDIIKTMDEGKYKSIIE